jgi:hypothetical protein
MRRSEGSWLGGFENGFGCGGGDGGVVAPAEEETEEGKWRRRRSRKRHARSISDPPSEAARNGHHHDVGVPMSVDDVRLHSMHLSLGYHGFGVGMGRDCIRFLARRRRRRRRLDRPRTNGFNLKRGRVGLLTRRGWVLHIRRLRLLGFRFIVNGSTIINSTHQHQHQQRHHHQQETQLHVDETMTTTNINTSSELTPLFPANLILSAGWCCYLRFAALVVVLSEHAYA